MDRTKLFNPQTASDWYWLADDGRLFSSRRIASVSASDADYQSWLKDGFTASPWPRDANGAQTVAALQTVLNDYGLFASLSAYAAAKRYAVEIGGITVNGSPIATDRVSQAMIGNAYAYVQASGAQSVSYKTPTGFVMLTADQIKAVALAVGAHVQACFAAENAADTGASANPASITTAGQVDALFSDLTTG